MTMSRSKRKAYNRGRHDGYMEGYAKGLYDGNPFNRIVEAVSSMTKTIADNPELMAEVLKMKGKTPEELDEELDAEESEEEE